LRNFYIKLSLIFLFLLIVMAVASIAVAFRISQRHMVEVDQQVNKSLAQDMALEIEPQLKDSVGSDQVGLIIHYMMVMNPAIEIYLLNSTGTIIGFYASPGKQVELEKVNLEPVLDFIEGSRKFPIFGDDPRHPGEKKHFSAAPVSIGAEEKGYLYIILQSSLYDSAASELLEEYQLLAFRNGILITLPIVAFTGLILFFYLTQRLKTLTRSVKAFGGGDLRHRARVNSKDEVGELAESFNQMADTIVGNIDKLEEADRLRRDLVMSVSHDLRNPLASIRGYLETLTLKDDTISEEKRREYLDILLHNTTVLHHLIDNLFELSKLEGENIKPNAEVFSLSELVQDVLMKMRPEQEKQGISLEMEEPSSLFRVQGDIRMIERVLTNLLENALRYTPAGGLVRVDLKPEEGNIVTSITDNGYGIAEEDLSRIFDRFYIGDASRTHSKKGSGLGLAICRRILELHGSTINVSSVQGEGSTFSFSLGLI